MINDLIPVEEHPSLMRDKRSKALINTDIASLNEYKNKKRMIEDVNILKNDVQEIKHLLLQLVNNR